MKKDESISLKMLWELFTTFFKIGLFTFGGGYAMIPLIEEEVIETKKWSDESELLDIIAIAESTPGPLAINTATFIGYKMNGVLGSLAATCGVILPSFIIISIIALFLDRFSNAPWVQYAFKGIRSGVIVLMLGAVIKLSKNIDKCGFTFSLIAISFCLVTFFNVSTFFVLVLSAIAGIGYQVRMAKGGTK